jgi:CDP-4-dehydro-6-deoxyglucose reductase, E1
MVDIDQKIEELIKDLGQDYKILQYVYNGGTFIPGKTPVYYSGPYFNNLEIIASIKSLLIGKWISSGENVQKFEHEFAKKINQLFGVMVNSGSSANLIMLASLKKYYAWEDDSEIIVSVVGFPTTVSTIYQNRMIPVFVDIEPETLNFDLSLIESKINNKTKAILLSPVLGNPPNIDDLVFLCEKYDLKLILDCCDSLGSKWRDQYLGEYAVASSHSFYPAHTISTGEGGMITTNIREVANIAKRLINWGRGCVCVGEENLLPQGVCNRRFSCWLDGYPEVIDHKYLFSEIGYNLKPLDLQGSIGLVQLEKLDEILIKRNNSKKVISDLFIKYIDEIKIPKILNHSDPIAFGTPFICSTKEQKQKLVIFLEKNFIQTRNYFAGNLLLHPGYKKLDDYRNYTISNLVYDRVFFVGASPAYGTEIFDYFEDTLSKFKND